MEFGYTLVSQYKQDRDITRIGSELTHQVELAREGGFDMVSVSEHHVTDDQYLNNEALLPYLANHVGGMGIGTGICLLPYHHPVRVAEWGATVDVLTGGNFSLGVGQGYRDEEFDAFGIDKEDALGRFVEGIQIIKKLWTEDSVSYDGRHYELDDVSINPKPHQDPRPPIYIGASNTSSVQRAARIADGWLGAHVPLDVIDEYASAFRDERASTDHNDGYVSIGREAFVAETTEEAEEIVRETLMRKYERYIDWGQDEVFESDDFRSQWEQLKEDRFLVGSPEDVIREIERYQETVDPDRIGVRMQYQGLDFEDVRSSLELFSEEVIPSFES
ncbi:luciferase [Natrinema sp. CBA1119]|uniref:LLM class flavin-dependent oxidoreductase n=1 Tax=Natrinema sp. CBA1119 TaxID=1608465 RepID=UPI000BF67D6A|nr:LLM class flavin-dependent oxidoreductase [Natrinema sp. CBA1119]PGF13842.1 luciferase [Natrinema sp. CBA1119]